MIAITVVQCVCVIFSLVCLGQAIKKDATNFDKGLFGVFCFLFLILCIGLQGVR